MNPQREAPETAALSDDGGSGQSHRIRYQEVFEFAPDAQLVTDPQGIILAANHAAADLLRCPKEFLPGKPLGLFAAPGRRGRFYEALAALSRGANAEVFEAVVARRGEEVRDVAMAATPENPVGVGAEGVDYIHWRLTDTTRRKRAEAERDALLRRLVTAQEDERRRVARDLHDSVGQLLAALSLAVRALADAGPLPPAAAARISDVQSVSDQLAREMHGLAVRLRPTALDDLGLEAGLGQLATEWARRTGVPADFHAAGLGAGRLPPDTETAIYRVVQEALTNVGRHAQAGQASVAVTRLGDVVVTVVEDDGVGFDPESAGQGRLGMIGMRERVALAGGELEVESSPGGGTTVIARLPLPAADRGNGL